ncbi:hypothetical protein R83H12_02551 [Fibrobacteria bacterium R8-3-H12]
MRFPLCKLSTPKIKMVYDKASGYVKLVKYDKTAKVRKDCTMDNVREYFENPKEKKFFEKHKVRAVFSAKKRLVTFKFIPDGEGL